jgi:SAM-dependent methyltransferase
MSATQSEPDQNTAPPRDPAPVFLDARREFAERFLAGEGLEIGALHLPLAMPPRARVSYVDRMPVERLRSEYPELAEWDLVEVDVVDDGERLETVPEASQDIIVANHFHEHCEDPIRTIETHLGKLRPGGILFYAVPDKRFTFDHQREITPLEHIVEDHEHGPERSRSEHYEQWTRLVIAGEAPEGLAGEDFEQWALSRAGELERDAYSIHFHVWTQAEFLRLVLHCRERLEEAFDIEAAARQGIEFMVVLRKAGTPSMPPSIPAPGTGTPRWRRAARRLRSRLRSSA